MRVSSKSQDVASQEPELRRWAAQQQGEIRWYRDRFTGKTMERPAFTRLLRHVRTGEVQQIAVWRLDRLGRTAKGLTALFDELTELNVRLVSLRDGLDLSTAAGRLMANVLASVAAYETEVRAERILAGQAAARAKGKTWGGSEKGRRIKVNEEQIRLIHRMKAEGEKVAAIARATGLSRPTIYDMLKTEPALQKHNSEIPKCFPPASFAPIASLSATGASFLYGR
ncbi:MAG: recombinase family protein [Planctomycetaceae bacterium]